MKEKRVGWKIADIFKQNIGMRMTSKQVAEKLLGKYDSYIDDDITTLLYQYADAGALKVQRIFKQHGEIVYDTFILPKPEAGQLLDSFSEYLINRDLNDM